MANTNPDFRILLQVTLVRHDGTVAASHVAMGEMVLPDAEDGDEDYAISATDNNFELVKQVLADTDSAIVKF